jgi:hypothetical protein
LAIRLAKRSVANEREIEVRLVQGLLSHSLNLIQDFKKGSLVRGRHIVGRSQAVYLLDQERHLRPVQISVAVPIDQAEARVRGVAFRQGSAQHVVRVEYFRPTHAGEFVYEMYVNPQIGERNLRGEWNSSRSTERQRESGKHRKVGVKLDALQAANAQRGQPVLVL